MEPFTIITIICARSICLSLSRIIGGNQPSSFCIASALLPILLLSAFSWLLLASLCVPLIFLDLPPCDSSFASTASSNPPPTYTFSSATHREQCFLCVIGVLVFAFLRLWPHCECVMCPFSLLCESLERKREKGQTRSPCFKTDIAPATCV